MTSGHTFLYLLGCAAVELVSWNVGPYGLQSLVYFLPGLSQGFVGPTSYPFVAVACMA